MQADYSKDALFRFIETALRQGLYNANTAAGYRAAAGRLLEDVAATDDVRAVDSEAAVVKYHNKHPGDLSPKSLRSYKQRLIRLLREFVQYTENPAGYTPRGRGPAKRDGERAAKPTRAPKSATAEESGLTLGDIVDATVTPASPALVMQYPLRENFAAQVVLPRNLTLDEARRLCAFIRTLAADFTPPPDS